MTYKINKQEFENVIKLESKKRYFHFIKKITDWQEVWTLKSSGGFVIFGDNEERQSIPVWPHPDYASALATDSWKECTPELIDLKVFITKWIPGMTRDNRFIAVFPTPDNKGIIIQPEILKADLTEELKKMEE